MLFCGGQKIWGVPEEDFLSSVIGKSHPVFQAEDASGYPLRELDSMAPGAGFFLSFYEYKDAKLPYRLLEYEIERGQRLFALFSARRLMELLIRDNLDREAEVLGTRLTRLFPDDYYLAKTFTASRYWQKRDVSSDLNELARHFPQDTGKDAEYQLFRAVNSIRTEQDGWEREVKTLVREYPASQEHTRFYGFIRIHDMENKLDPDVLDCLLMKLKVQDRHYSSAFALFRTLPPEFMSSVLLDDFYTVVSASGQLSSGIEYLDGVIGHTDVPDALTVKARMYRGFIYRKKGFWSKALEDFSFAAEHTADTYSRQRMAWYVLYSQVKTNPADAFERFAPYKEYVADPGYFTDVLSEWTYDLLAVRNYRQIEHVYENVKDFASPSFLSFVSYVLFRLDDAGMYQTAADADELKRFILNPNGDRYYRMLYAYVTNTPFSAPEQSASELPVSDEEGHPVVVRGFFDFGLDEIAYDYLLPYRDELSDEGVLSFSQSLLEAGRPWEAIRVAQWRPGASYQELNRLLFPKGFEEYIESTATEYSLPPWLLYSLIRTESFFNPGAVSHAGAVGLSQLMPETARDVSRRLRLSGVDLTDPASNIAIGGWYVSHLIGRTDSPAYALLAYNAGLTRVRRWQDEWQGIPLDLCIELVPYEETRNYVKKILRSSLSYGYIYGAADAGDVLSYIFPQSEME